jgi:hypothetical protein
VAANTNEELMKNYLPKHSYYYSCVFSYEDQEYVVDDGFVDVTNDQSLTDEVKKDALETDGLKEGDVIFDDDGEEIDFEPYSFKFKFLKVMKFIENTDEDSWEWDVIIDNVSEPITIK